MDFELRALLARAGEGDDVALAEARARLAATHGDEVAGLLGGAADVPDVLAILDELADPAADALRAALDDDRAPDVADAVMAALALPWVDVSGAVEAEAAPAPDVARGFDPGAVPVAEAVIAEAGVVPELALGFDPGALPVAAAVREEAGAVDVVDAVLGELGLGDALGEAWLSALLDRALPVDQHVLAAERVGKDAALRATLTAWADLGRRVREGVVAEAGAAPDVWRAVAPEVGVADPDHVPGWDETLLGEAVRAEAGSVDVVDTVLARVKRDVVVAAPVIPEPANPAGWLVPAALGALALAAAVLLVVRVLDVRGGPAGSEWTERPVAFASAEELQLDQVRYGENQSVFVEVPTEAEAPVIVWVDDGGNL